MIWSAYLAIVICSLGVGCKMKHNGIVFEVIEGRRALSPRDQASMLDTVSWGLTR